MCIRDLQCVIDSGMRDMLSGLDHRDRSRHRCGEQRCHDVHCMWVRDLQCVIDSGMRDMLSGIDH